MEASIIMATSEELRECERVCEGCKEKDCRVDEEILAAAEKEARQMLLCVEQCKRCGRRGN